jgi:glucose/arabinose dehydrogenase
MPGSGDNKMNRKIALISGLVIAFSAITSFYLSPQHQMQAEETTSSALFLPVVKSPFSLSLLPLVKDIESPSVVTDIADAGGGRLFIAMRDGHVFASSVDGSLKPELILDIRDKVLDNGNEAGLVGLAVHPDFATNGTIFLFYVESEENNYFTVVARYQVGSDGRVDPESEERLLRFAIPTLRHVGGAMHFGPNDGFLYIAVGDGGIAFDQTGNAQSTQTFMGKILRIDVNNSTLYAIPSENPFTGDPGSLGEIWALGLRNPWRFSFDRETGDMYIGDVGENTWEEINFIPTGSPGGENFGWSCKEGPEELNSSICDSSKTYTEPIYYYRHDTCAAVIGGYVYRGSNLPEITGQYIFADLCDGEIWSLIRLGDQTWEPYNWGYLGQRYTSFGERSDGEILLGAYDRTVYLLVRSEDSD